MMTRRLMPAAVVLLFCGSVYAAEPAAASAHQDLLLLGPLEPLRVRLLIEVDGVPFRKIWLDTFDRQFALFDTDRKGALSSEQVPKFLAAFRRGEAAGPVASKPAGAAMMADQRLSRTELQRQMELAKPPISLRQRQASQGAGPALIPLLDTDGDGRLSREELSFAEQSLHCRDFNDDQLITQQELIAGPSSDADPGAEANPAAQGSVILLTDALDRSAVAEILLSRYDRNRDGMLSLHVPAEIISADGAAAMAVLDVDQNQMLSRPELLGFTELPLDAELPLSFGDSTKKKGWAAEKYRLRSKSSDGGYRLHIGSGQVNFGRSNRDPSRDNRLPRLRDFDADNNESLDANELMNVPDRPDFAMLDGDHDGKITATEFDSFFQQQARIAAAQIVLEVSDEGSDLFTTMDTNFDRVLTPRELKSAPDLLATEDRDGDGFLGGVEMSYSLELKLSRGGTPTPANNLVSERRAMAEPNVKDRKEGPAWFQKMDRNRDGDVSLSEFLGSREAFRKLDQDGNQLLSLDELP